MADVAPVRIEHDQKWIRGMHSGRVVISSRDVRLVWEHPYYPAWYVPLADVHGDLHPNGSTFASSRRGEGTRHDLIVDGATISDCAWRHLDSAIEELRGLVRFEWSAMDSWFEEDVEVFVHPRSPEVRIDALASSRHVRVLVDGQVVADSVRPTILFETNLPERYYLPRTDVRMDLLTPTDTTTACPYKGWAHYWSVAVDGETHPDLAWGYRTPLPESEAVAGLVCFYSEKVDIEIDGVLQSRPATKFA